MEYPSGARVKKEEESDEQDGACGLDGRHGQRVHKSVEGGKAAS